MVEVFDAAVVIASIIGFTISSIAGSGGVLLLIPILATRMPIYEATAFATVPMLVNNLLKLLLLRGDIDWKVGFRILGWAMPASLFANWFAADVPQAPLKLGIAAVTLLSLRVSTERRSQRPWSVPVSGLGVGALSGLLGTAGPSAPAALRALGLEGARFVGTMALFGAGLQLFRLPVYGIRAEVPAGLWRLWLLSTIIAAVTPWVGRRIQRRVPPRLSGLLVKGMIVVSAGSLVISTVR